MCRLKSGYKNIEYLKIFIFRQTQIFVLSLLSGGLIGLHVHQALTKLKKFKMCGAIPTL